MSQSVYRLLANHLAHRHFDGAIEGEDCIRYGLIDTLGCLLAGSRQRVVVQVSKTVLDWGGGQAPVYGSGAKTAPPWAAFVNAVAAHCLDFDDWEVPGNSHISAVLFPALLATAAGRGVSGRALLDAYVAGYEVIARLGEVVNFDHYNRGWHSTATLGSLGAAAAVARLLKLDADQMTNAISIATSQSAGLTSQFGSDAKAMQAGFAAKTGIEAGFLAAQGLSGNDDVFEGEKGFACLMSDGGVARLEAVFGDYPKSRLAVEEYGLVIKPYPCCGYTHRLIDCAKIIRRQAGFDASQVVNIAGSLPVGHGDILPFTYPEDLSQALFSLPYVVALALLGRTVSLEELARESWKEAEVEKLIGFFEKRLHKVKRPELNLDPDDPDWMEVKTADGRLFRAEVAYPLGSPENPMSARAVMQKFKDNIDSIEYDTNKPLMDADRYSVKLGDEINVLERWPECSDITQLLARFESI